MKHSVICRLTLLCLFGCLSALGAGKPNGDRPTGDRMDRAWKRYRNPNLGYCVSYPSRWSMGSAFEGSGLFVEAGSRRSAKPDGEIDIGPVRAADAAEDARVKAVGLNEDLQQELKEHLDGLQKFARAERLEVIEQHSLALQGATGLYAKNRYYDPLERTSWMEEIVFVRHKGELYRMELQCPPDQIKRFEAVFSYLVNSFEFDCK